MTTSTWTPAHAAARRIVGEAGSGSARPQGKIHNSTDSGRFDVANRVSLHDASDRKSFGDFNSLIRAWRCTSDEVQHGSENQQCDSQRVCRVCHHCLHGDYCGQTDSRSESPSRAGWTVAL